MKPVFGSDGRRALAALLARPRVILGFDFDGTLAPIVARPDDARMPLPVARRLRELVRRWPVAVVSGRAVADVGARLDFQPTYLLGSHGIEEAGDAPTPLMMRCAVALDPLRRALDERAQALAAAGVTAEDKRYSMALHYRLAPNEAAARAAIASLLEETLRATAGVGPAGLQIGEGKCVVNLVAAGAPDKGDAMLELAARCGAEAGLFIGDDLNDEPMFAKAPAAWVTVRVARDHVLSQARFYLDGTPQLPALLDLLLEQPGPR
ncbi:MAG: trehalose-phosphatase [Rubrivivax sp.]|nr:trehalose-phosphatase [Rubrivivax sp.]